MGVSGNMFCFPTCVLMWRMNIHEDEADIARWRRRWRRLCARGLWWPAFWGIRGAPLLMMQMCVWVLICVWMTRSRGLSSLSGGGGWSLCLASSCPCRAGTRHKTWRRNCRSAVYSPSSFLWSWLVTKHGTIRLYGPKNHYNTRNSITKHNIHSISQYFLNVPLVTLLRFNLPIKHQNSDPHSFTGITNFPTIL